VGLSQKILKASTKGSQSFQTLPASGSAQDSESENALWGLLWDAV